MINVSSGSTKLKIDVMNKNNKLPYFRPPTQRAEVPEDTEAGAEVFRLAAFDEDSLGDSLVYSVISPVTAINKDGQRIENQVQWSMIIESHFDTYKSKPTRWLNKDLNSNDSFGVYKH